MSSERITFGDIYSGIRRLIKTRNPDGFLEGLEYTARMNELNRRLKSPKVHAGVEKETKVLKAPVVIIRRPNLPRRRPE